MNRFRTLAVGMFVGLCLWTPLHALVNVAEAGQPVILRPAPPPEPAPLVGPGAITAETPAPPSSAVMCTSFTRRFDAPTGGTSMVAATGLDQLAATQAELIQDKLSPLVAQGYTRFVYQTDIAHSAEFNSDITATVICLAR